MKHSHRIVSSTGCLLALGSLSLVLAPPARTGEPPRQPAAEAMKAIVQVIGDAPCDGPADCRTVGVGAKSCGGPESYLAWSVRHTDAAELEKRVAQHRTLRRAEDRRDGRVSNCAVTPEPATSCVAGHCRIEPAATTAR